MKPRIVLGRTSRHVLALLAMLLLASVALTGARCSNLAIDNGGNGGLTSQTPTPIRTTGAQVHERPLPPTSTVPLPSATPEDAMRSWYLAWFASDMLAAKRTSRPDFADTIAEETFEGGDVIDYKILGSEGAAGTMAFYISETREDVLVKTPMTVLVSATDAGDGYLVKGYQDTPAGTKPAEKVRDSNEAVHELDAQLAVTGALRALQHDKVPDAQALATARFVKANPRWFAPASGALIDFSIASVVKRHNVWVVQIAETWRGEPQMTFTNFIVADVEGDARIDRVEGWY